MGLFRKKSQTTSKYGKNQKVAPYLLLNRLMTTYLFHLIKKAKCRYCDDRYASFLLQIISKNQSKFMHSPYYLIITKSCFKK